MPLDSRTARGYCLQLRRGLGELWIDFVNTANPNRLNEDVGDDQSKQPLHSDNRFECLDYHNPFPSIYLDHLRQSRVSYEGVASRRVRGNSVSNRSGAVPTSSSSSTGLRSGGESGNGSGVGGRSDSGDSSGGAVDEQSSALRASMAHGMRQVAEGVKILNTTPQGNIILRWILHVFIALAVALVAFCMIWAADSLYEWRYHVLRDLVKEKNGYTEGNLGKYLLGWLFWVSTSVLAVGVGAAAVHFVPAAGGSGLPDVISFLNGVMRPKVVNLKTFFGKAISCVCCVGGGMPAGMEAPLIHIGAIVGSGVTQGRSRTLNCKTPLFQSLRTNKDRRDFITAGAACGVSAAFGAPIGGLLFIMEEVASFWDHNNSGQVFLATMISFTTIAFLNSLKNELLHNAYVLFEVNYKIALNITACVPAIFLGIICGLLASAFTKVNMMIIKWRRRVIRPYPLRKFLEPVLIAIVYVSATYWLGLVGPCYDTVAPSTDAAEEIIHYQTENITDLSNLGCSGRDIFNPLATLSLKTSKETIRHLFTRRTVDQFTAGPLVCFFILYICSSCYTSGSAVSTGLVVPMLVLGATVGRIYGLIIMKGFASSVDGVPKAYHGDQSWMDPGVYALIGAGAFFSGCTRMMISVCVIMVELAGDLHYLLPCMVAIVVAKTTADYFAKPLYHAQLHLDHVPFLPSHWDESMMEAYTAADVMSSNVVSLREQEYTTVVLSALRSTQHNAFPIVRPLPDGSEKFVGMVTREDIQVYLALPELQVAESTPASESPDRSLLNANNSKSVAQREDPHETIAEDQHCPSDLLPENLPPCVKEASRLTWSEWVAHQSSLFLKMGDRKWHEMWEMRLAGMLEPSPSKRGGGDTATVGISSLPPVVDLSIITNRSPYVVPPFFNLSLTYGMFRSVGLRHLCVVDGQTVVGVITRKDLLNFSEKGLREGSTAEFNADPSALARGRSRSSSLSEAGKLAAATMSASAASAASSSSPTEMNSAILHTTPTKASNTNGLRQSMSTAPNNGGKNRVAAPRRSNAQSRSTSQSVDEETNNSDNEKEDGAGIITGDSLAATARPGNSAIDDFFGGN